MSLRLPYRVSKVRYFPSQHEDFWQSELHQGSYGDKFCRGLLKDGPKRPLRYSMFLCQEWTRNGFYKCCVSSFPRCLVPLLSLRQEQKRAASLLTPPSHAEKMSWQLPKRETSEVGKKWNKSRFSLKCRFQSDSYFGRTVFRKERSLWGSLILQLFTLW